MSSKCYRKFAPVVAVLLAIAIEGVSALSADETSGMTAQLPQITTTLELVSDNVASNVIHGWQTNRIIKYDGLLYASGDAIQPNERDFWDHSGIFFRRNPAGQWTEAGPLPYNPYTMLVGPEGRFWAVAPSAYSNAHVYHMSRALDFDSFQEVHNGTCSYLGASVSPEGNFLVLYAERTDFQINVPNAVIAAFYDQPTGQWYTSRLVTPEGRYGYEGIILRGRKALAVLNSAIADAKANPTPPHYNWRHVRLARCDDLTKGEWINQGWLMSEFGSTSLQDLMVGPDGNAYLAYGHVGGSTYEEASSKPFLHYIARIRDDLSVETFPTGISAAATRILVDSKGGWHLVGHPSSGGNLHLWDLDPDEGFQAVTEYELPGTDILEGYVIHTLRPERFGGEDDGDTVHLLTAHYIAANDAEAKHAELWHAYFQLPVGD